MSKPVFLLMPEWQGSASSRAMQLAEGAEALREDLPSSSTVEVEVPLEAGDAMGTPVARLSSLLRAREAAHAALATATEASAAGANAAEATTASPSASDGGASGQTPAPVAVTVGGDCASSLTGIEAAIRAHGAAGLAVLWFDAHPDLQHPSTSPSGAASGMTLRHALGDGTPDLALETPIDASCAILVGARSFDPEELAEIEQRGIAVVDPPAFDARDFDAALEHPDTRAAAEGTAGPSAGAADGAAAFARAVADRLAACGASAVYVHVDLDVLDPAEFAAVHEAVPFGLSVAQLVAAIRAAVATLPLAGAAICEFAPADAAAASEDLPTVLRVLGAITSGLQSGSAA